MVHTRRHTGWPGGWLTASATRHFEQRQGKHGRCYVGSLSGSALQEGVLAGQLAGGREDQANCLYIWKRKSEQRRPSAGRRTGWASGWLT